MTLLDEATSRRKGIHRPSKNNAPAAAPSHVSRDAMWSGCRLMLGRRTIATIVPDQKWPDMWRVQITGRELTDMVNLSRAKDAAISLACGPA
jgi:hypothetical protein